MVNRELIEVFSEIAREKNVERSELAKILEALDDDDDVTNVYSNFSGDLEKLLEE